MAPYHDKLFWMKLIKTVASTVIVTLVPAATVLPDLAALRAALRSMNCWRFGS
jgi:hypothetical protein